MGTVAGLLGAGVTAAAVPDAVPPDAVFLADGQTLTWNPAPGATSHHLYRGNDPALGDHECREFATPSTSLPLPETPEGPGGLIYFLVSGVNVEGEGPLGDDQAGTPRPNASPCTDGDGDSSPDNLDNCPAAANASQADQNLDAVGDACDPLTYDFESDATGQRPAEMTQSGGPDASFVVFDAGGDLAVAYDAASPAASDRFDRLPADRPFQNTTVWVDYAPGAESFSIELWSDGAHGWNAGGGIVLQVDPANGLVLRERRGQDLPSSTGPAAPSNGRMRLRLVKGPGVSSMLHVDSWDGQAFVPGWASFPIADDHLFRGLFTALASHDGGRRATTRVTVAHEIPTEPLTLHRHPSWSTDWKVFQRSAGGAADVPVRFAWSSTDPGRIQARVIRTSNGSVLPGHDWTDHELVAPVSPGGTNGALTLAGVPEGGNYDVEVRLVRDSDSAVLGQDALVHVAVGDVFVAGGQSNMAGYSGVLGNAEAAVDEVHLFHNDGTWKRASEPMDDGTDQVDRVSEEFPAHSLMLRFAKDVAQATGVPVGVIPGPLGGTNLFSQWQRNGADPDDRGTLYGSLLHRTLLQSYATPPTGFLWFQGESDVGRTTAQYKADLNALVANMRSDLGHPGLYFLNAQLGTSFGGDLNAWLEIREAQRQAALEDPLAALVTTADQPRVDTVHFNVSGYKNIGRRFAAAAREMIYGQPVDALVHLVEARAGATSSQIDLDYEAAVTGGGATLYQVSDGGGIVTVTGVSAAGSTISLTLSRAIQGQAVVSYGYSSAHNAPWVLDSAGRAVPLFKNVTVAP